MRKKKVLLVIAFVAIAIVSSGIVSAYAMKKSTVEVKGVPQAEVAEAVEMVQMESGKQAEEMTFSCEISGCTQTEAHEHGLCGIDGCTQIGEHNHDICGIAECTETETHMHDGIYCYPHSADDGHAYHTCGVAGCTEAESHAHNSCGVAGCTQTGEHEHGGNGGSHHESGHHGGGHH